MQVIKRDGTLQEFDKNKIVIAISKAVEACCPDSIPMETIRMMVDDMHFWDGITIEEVQDIVIETLRDWDYEDIASNYASYRNKQSKLRFIEDRLAYMERYSESSDNAASSSETDPNSNVSQKNVANLEGEVYKENNREIQRYRMKKQLKKMYPELASQYEIDLNNHIIYVHDEASCPVLKPYCMAVTLYPLMMEGVGKIDGVTPSAPNDIQSFSGQITNLAFLLSSQCKGAVAFGDYFIALNYYVIKEFGEQWYTKLDVITSTEHCLNKETVKKAIRKGMKQFIYGVNQPAGNRSFNSPFTNLSFYDKYYFESLFGEFYYPDGTQPEWDAIDTLQRIFMELHRELRLIKPLTFPVTTMALVHNNKEYLDQEYKELCAEEWAKGGSFFCYNNDNPTSLASCCRVLNEMSDNTFSSTTGMTGVMTGSCNVITLNLNRIIQDWFNQLRTGDKVNIRFGRKECADYYQNEFKEYLINILDRVYKYHIAYKTMLYDLEDKNMFAASNGDYIYLKKLYSTIGVIGYGEAAKFLRFEVSNNPEYIDFLQLVLSTIRDQNREHAIKDKNRPFLFNSEAIPGENLAVKLYQWDKSDGYYVPEDQNLYNCYFYNPWDNTSVLDKLELHGSKISEYTDGGQAIHINLQEHLSKEQYLKLLNIAMEKGSNYFTFNIPMSECSDCNHTVNAPITECPICHGVHIKWWTRIIGYLTCVNSWSNERQIEQKTRVYSKSIN